MKKMSENENTHTVDYDRRSEERSRPGGVGIAVIRPYILPSNPIVIIVHSNLVSVCSPNSVNWSPCQKTNKVQSVWVISQYCQS